MARQLQPPEIVREWAGRGMLALGLLNLGAKGNGMMEEWMMVVCEVQPSVDASKHEKYESIHNVPIPGPATVRPQRCLSLATVAAGGNRG